MCGEFVLSPLRSRFRCLKFLKGSIYDSPSSFKLAEPVVAAGLGALWVASAGAAGAALRRREALR